VFSGKVIENWSVDLENMNCESVRIDRAKLCDHFVDLKSGSWDDMPVAKYFEVGVVREYWSHGNSENKPVKKWPGPQKYVFVWVELENGKAVGWNENPSRGWTFPVVTLPKE